MANNNNIDGVISTTNTQLIGNGYTLPSDFNNSRQPGELATLFNANSNVIYNKFSAKTGYTNSLLKFGPRQPFITSNPNNHSTLYSTRAFPFGSAVDDLKRISKWQVSGDGLIFIAKQFFLQKQNAFNETNLYNPLMPIQSVASTLSFGLLPTPTRFIDLSGGFASLLGFGSSPQPVSTTVATDGKKGKDSLSDIAKSKGNPYKGLLRGQTATEGYTNLTQYWEGGGNSSLLGNYFKTGFNKLFGGSISVGQPTKSDFRADENTYGLMLGNYTNFTSVMFRRGLPVEMIGVYQRWWGNNGDGKISHTPVKYSRFTPFISTGYFIDREYSGTINNKPYAVNIEDSNNPNGYKYADYVGIERWKKGGEEGLNIDSLEYSDQVVNYAYYIGKENKYLSPQYFEQRSKLNDPTDYRVEAINDNLKKVITGLTKQDINASNQNYKLGTDRGYEYTPLSQYNKDANLYGYDYINRVTEKPQFKYFDKDRFKSTTTLDPVPEATGDNKTYGFAGTQRSDKINTLGVLASKDFGQNKKYNPDIDDLIAFYIYDMVNDKYLPFRSTIKGVSESLTAEWNDVSYLGRADKLYTYKGFTRTISFNLLVNVTSIKELQPTWQRINYLAGLVKPSNYTSKNSTEPAFSRFVVPPLIKFTIGDLYVDQPATITSLGISIPEDASWETLNENYSKNNDWSYLHNVIQWEKSNNKYAQLPRTVDVSISMNLLEKEKPIAGGSHFGSSYRSGSNYAPDSMTNNGSFSSTLIVN